MHNPQTAARSAVSAEADYATLGCTHPGDPYCFPTRVQVRLATLRRITCTVHVHVDGSLPTATREIFAWTVGDTPQRLALVDARGRPWVDLDLASEVRLFDPSGRERTRIASEHGLSGRRLTLHCWDKAGHALDEQAYLMP